jgi:hypothetical protein
MAMVQSPDAETVLSVRPDDIPEFRFAQLLLMLAEAGNAQIQLDLERLSVADFIAANPFLLLASDDHAYRRIRLAGFGQHSLSYAAPGQRFATRRGRLMHDLNMLLAYGLIAVYNADGGRRFRLTDSGAAMAAQLVSSYADAYRASAAETLPRISRLNDAQLRRSLRVWLHADPLLFDLLDIDQSAGELFR